MGKIEIAKFVSVPLDTTSDTKILSLFKVLSENEIPYVMIDGFICFDMYKKRDFVVYEKLREIIGEI